MKGRQDLSEEDLSTIVDYIDGRLPAEKMVAFEIRLSKEPGLADALESFAMMDHLQVATQDYHKRAALQFLSGGLKKGLVAAAVLLALIIGGHWTWQGFDRNLAIEVTILASPSDIRQFNPLVGLESDELPPGFHARSGGQNTEPVPDQEYLARVAPKQRERVEAALERGRTTVTAGHYVVPVRPSTTSFAIVLAVDRRGSVYRSESPLEEAAFSTVYPLEGRITHVLPTESLSLVEDMDGVPRVNYHPGFLVPRGVGGLDVILALRLDDVDTDLQADLTLFLSELAESAPAHGGHNDPVVSELEAWLSDRQFSIRRLKVREP